MSTVKISQLPVFNMINANTANTLFVGVDVPTLTTFQMTATTLAQGLYSNNILNVGINQQNLPNTIAQFALGGQSYVQTNLVNTNDGGTADIVVTANTGSGGSDSAFFIDMGFANKNVQPGLEFNNLGTAIYPLDGYLYVQGGAINAPGGPGGNLTIGTTTANTEIKFIGGGHDAANVVFKVTGDGLKMINGHPIFFTDGTTQNTAASSAAYSQAGYAQANLAYTIAVNANNLVNYQTGIDLTQNTNTQLAWNLANTAVQNTANIILPGNVIFNGANTSFNSNIVTFGTMTTTGNVVTTGNLTATGPVTFNGNFVNNGQTTNNGNTINNGNLTTTGNVISIGYLTANGTSTFNGNTVFKGYVTVANNLTVDSTFTINVASQLLTMNGIITVQSSNFPSNSSGMRIDGSNNGIAQATTSTGTMLQIVGLDGGYATRVLIDNYSNGSSSAYPLFAARAARGNSSVPAPVQTNDLLFRVVGNGYGNTYTLLGGGSIDVVALENYTDATKGSQINLTTTPIGTNTRYTTVSVNTSVVTVNTNLNVANTIVANTYAFSNTSNTGVVTQQTNKSTSVTANGIFGQIIMNNAQLNAGSGVTFTVNNSYVQHVGDIPMVAIQNPVTTGIYQATVSAVRVGSFDIFVYNNGAGPGNNKSDAIVLNWALMRVGN